RARCRYKPRHRYARPAPAGADRGPSPSRSVPGRDPFPPSTPLGDEPVRHTDGHRGGPSPVPALDGTRSRYRSLNRVAAASATRLHAAVHAAPGVTIGSRRRLTSGGRTRSMGLSPGPTVINPSRTMTVCYRAAVPGRVGGTGQGGDTYGSPVRARRRAAGAGANRPPGTDRRVPVRRMPSPVVPVPRYRYRLGCTATAPVPPCPVAVPSAVPGSGTEQAGWTVPVPPRQYRYRTGTGTGLRHRTSGTSRPA